MGNLLNVLTRIVPLALGIIGAVEKMFGAIHGKGSEKRVAYIDAVMTALGVTESLTGKDIVNDEKFKNLMGKLADVVIEINNFIRDFKNPTP